MNVCVYEFMYVYIIYLIYFIRGGVSATTLHLTLWNPDRQQMGGEGEPAHSASRHAALFGDTVL